MFIWSMLAKSILKINLFLVEFNYDFNLFVNKANPCGAGEIDQTLLLCGTTDEDVIACRFLSFGLEK